MAIPLGSRPRSSRPREPPTLNGTNHSAVPANVSIGSGATTAGQNNCQRDPRGRAVHIGDGKNDVEVLPKYKRDLNAKIKALRVELQLIQPRNGHCRIEVTRKEIFEVHMFYNFLKLLTRWLIIYN